MRVSIFDNHGYGKISKYVVEYISADNCPGMSSLFFQKMKNLSFLVKTSGNPKYNRTHDFVYNGY